MNTRGGFTNYGQDIGVLMLDTRFPRVAGDIGNARTFPFPVKYLTVKGASPERVVMEQDPALLEPFIEAARELEGAGVKAITTSCGFLAMFQKELAAAVSVPMFTSSILQVPFLYALLGRKGKAGILTARAASLGPRHFEACGIRDIPLAVRGMDRSPEFTKVFMSVGSADTALDYDLVEKELSKASRDLVSRDPDIGFLVLECTNMPPFREAIRKACGRPVYDIVTLAEYVHAGLLVD